jgi:hypothetical protein
MSTAFVSAEDLIGNGVSDGNAGGTPARSVVRAVRLVG